MTPRERIECVLAGDTPDRMPILGGFLVAEKHYREISGATEAEFDTDPEAVAIRAYRQLGADALILLRLPPGKQGHWTYRAMNREGFEAHDQRFPTPEAVLAHVEALPTQADALAAFDADAYRTNLVASMKAMQKKLGDMLWLPTFWDMVHPTFEHYNNFGYGNYVEFLALYPEAASRLFGHDVEVKRAIASIVVSVYRELDIPPLVHVGTDICGKNGPVVSPALLREVYFPHVARGIEPLVDAGFTTVWHADGVIDPLIDDILACGVSGFQGFQWEYGVDLANWTDKRTITGDKLALFAGPSTSATLPFAPLADALAEVDTILTHSPHFRLFFLPANDILPDTPTPSLLATHRRITTP